MLAAARVAGAGGGPRRVLDALARRLTGSCELIYVDTLDYLRRGGRIGAAAHLVGSALSLKPLLTREDGKVAPLDKVLGSERALRKMVDTASESRFPLLDDRCDARVSLIGYRARCVTRNRWSTAHRGADRARDRRGELLVPAA